jgi:YD repeat-containing protein
MGGSVRSSIGSTDRSSNPVDYDFDDASYLLAQVWSGRIELCARFLNLGLAIEERRMKGPERN